MGMDGFQQPAEHPVIELKEDEKHSPPNATITIGFGGDWLAKMIRIISVVALAMICASCKTDTSPDLSRADPIISTTDYNAREDCLEREVARLVEPRSIQLISLQNIAMTATNFCSREIAAKLKGVSASAARDDQVKAEQRAFAIGLKLREASSSRSRRL
jgi:hypothetical protein